PSYRSSFPPRRSSDLLRICFLLLAGLWQANAVAQPASIDKVIAVAEDGVVLKSEFDERWNQAQEQISAGAMAPPPDILRQQILRSEEHTSELQSRENL